MSRHLFGFAVGALLAAAPASALTLAEAGSATAGIVLADDATKAEQTAANELAGYLQEITGGRFAVESASSPSRRHTYIFVGATHFAKERGLDASAMGPEEWAMRVVDGHLVLVGGRPRGTLYAVYRFLEEVVGVHWWNPFEESIPQRPDLVIEALDLRGKPTIRYRDIYMLYGNDEGRFAARNRLNRDGDSPIAARYGGEMAYGPPYHVHTFYKYIPPDTHFDEHLEWFSLLDGKRETRQAQLCLTNPELRQVFLDKLRAYIEETEVAARQAGKPAPVVYDVSQNDCYGMCQCGTCQAIAQAEGSEAGPLLDFVNFLADAIKDDHPGVVIDTLAYQMTQQPPKTIRPRDNVIIRLCDTTSNFIYPITHEENTAFREHLLRWSAISKNLRIWDYAVNYGRHNCLPMPTVHTYAADYQFYAEHNVEGVFTEHEYAVLADLRDFKVWMMMKLLEDPYRDYDALVRTFTDGFYGAAGEHVRQYLTALEDAAEAKPAYMSMGSVPQRIHYLDLTFLRSAMSLFDEAEAAVADDPVLLRRVRHARLGVERAAVVRWRQLVEEWQAAGNDPKKIPLDRAALAKRYQQAWLEQIAFRIPKDEQVNERAAADQEIRHLLSLPSALALPQKFLDLPRGRLVQYAATDTRNHEDIAKRVPDPEAESGMTNRLELSDNDAKKYALPMPWGLYDVAGKKHVGSATIKPEDVPGPGYQWYTMGSFTIRQSYYLYFFWSWIVQVEVDNVIDPGKPSQDMDVWACIKFEGPAFPYGETGQQNAICVERIVLVRK